MVNNPPPGKYRVSSQSWRLVITNTDARIEGATNGNRITFSIPIEGLVTVPSDVQEARQLVAAYMQAAYGAGGGVVAGHAVGLHATWEAWMESVDSLTDFIDEDGDVRREAVREEYVLWFSKQ